METLWLIGRMLLNTKKRTKGSGRKRLKLDNDKAQSDSRVQQSCIPVYLQGHSSPGVFSGTKDFTSSPLLIGTWTSRKRKASLGKTLANLVARLDIVRSWFNLMDEDGWIGREQILGQEARSKVPQEFQVQYPHYANPPTLFLVFEALIDKLKAPEMSKKSSDPLESIRSAHLQNPENAKTYLRKLYPLLKRHYFWFRKTQWGDVKSYDRDAFSTKEAYRWRGRSQAHILTSGLDDYPRPQPPHPGELHTDLISWMGMMTRSMRRIAETIGETDDAKEFQGYETGIVRNIDDLHWSKKEQTYCDATVDDYEESVHVCHKGYISIFPFLTGLLPADSPRLGAILDLISDPEELWSPYGLRSLSKSSPNYMTGENYWRSPVWMNINYLAVKALYVSVVLCKASLIYWQTATNILE